MDIVHRNYINENARVYFDEKHEWYYWHGLQADEVIAFIQADSEAEDRAGMLDLAPSPSSGRFCPFDTAMQEFPIRLF
jgi:hypothetical protein